jgi:hypothetical protein
MEALSGIKTGVENLYLEPFQDLPGQELQPHQNAVIKKCEGLAANVRQKKINPVTCHSCLSKGGPSWKTQILPLLIEV